MMSTDISPSMNVDSVYVEPKQVSQAKSAWPDYLTIWRWHFYAGLLCIPILLVLSVTGTIYLFKPQLQAMELGKYQAMLPESSNPHLPISDQVTAALGHIPGSKFSAYELPPVGTTSANPTTKLILQVNDRQLASYQDPVSGKVIGQQFQDELPENFAKKIHGELMLGKRGSYLVELTACWTLVMVLTGLILWWPRTGWRFSGVVIPRLRIGGRTFWKDIHSVSGFWLSGLIVFLVVSGLPWATFWGDYFRSIRSVTGTAVAKQDWSSGHGRRGGSGHRHDGAESGGDAEVSYQLEDINQVAAFAKSQSLPSPVLIRPPQDKSRVWTVQSETQNRPLRTTIKYDVAKAAVVSTDDFAKKHWIDKMVGQGIAIHEGARFGVINQLLSLLATSGLVLLSGTAIVMWWSRRQVGLGAPSKRHDSAYEVSMLRRIVLTLVLIVMAAAMPLFGISLVVVFLLDQLVFKRIPSVSRWLGLSRPT